MVGMDQTQTFRRKLGIREMVEEPWEVFRQVDQVEPPLGRQSP